MFIRNTLIALAFTVLVLVLIKAEQDSDAAHRAEGNTADYYYTLEYIEPAQVEKCRQSITKEVYSNEDNIYK